jgi:hypothetical protein
MQICSVLYARGKKLNSEKDNDDENEQEISSGAGNRGRGGDFGRRWNEEFGDQGGNKSRPPSQAAFVLACAQTEDDYLKLITPK